MARRAADPAAVVGGGRCRCPRSSRTGPAPIPPTNGRQPARGFTMFSAVKFVVAAVIVALFGGFLLAGVLTTPQGERDGPGSGDRVTITDDDRGVALGHGDRGGRAGRVPGRSTTGSGTSRIGSMPWTSSLATTVASGSCARTSSSDWAATCPHEWPDIRRRARERAYSRSRPTAPCGSSRTTGGPSGWYRTPRC